MAEKKYELSSAYVTILPSFEGMKERLKEEIESATPDMQNRFQKAMSAAGRISSSAFSKTFGAEGVVTRFGDVLKRSGASAFSSLGQLGAGALLKGIAGVGKKIGSILFNGAKGGVSSLANFMRTTLSSATSSAMAGVGSAIGAIGAQTLGGGLNRALDLNSATSKLAAFGYEAAEVDRIMNSVVGTVSGTRFSTPEAMTTATQLLAAGIKPGEEMEKILQNTVKLADMAGSDFGEMGSIVSKGFTGGVIQAEELNQILDRGIGITSYLAEEMGVTAGEIKKMGSEGKISFNDLMNAVEAVEFDSAILASNDVRLAFGNMRSAMSAIGEKFWTPIISRAAEFFLNLRNGIKALDNNDSFKTFMKRLNAGTESLVEKAINLSEKFEAFMSSDKIEPFLRAIEKIREAIRGIEGPVVGVGLAIASTFLGNLPIVGALFGGLTVPAGILIGIVATLGTKFSEFTRFLEVAFEAVQKFAEGLVKGLGFDSSKLFSDFGEDNPIQKFFANLTSTVENFNFSKLGEVLGKDFKEIFTTLMKELPRIGEAVMDLFEKLGTSMGTLSGGASAGGMVENISNIIIAIITGIGALLPVLTTIVTGIATVVTSDLFTTVFTTLVDVASFIVQNETLLLGLVAVLTAFFVTSKFEGMQKAIIKSSGVIGKAIEGFSKSMAKGMKAFFVMISVVATSAMGALPHIAIVALLIIALAGVVKLLDSMGFFEILREALSFAIESFITLIQGLTPVLAQVAEMINNFLLTIMTVLVNIVPVLVDAFTKIAEVFLNGFELIVTNSIELIDTLAEKGIKAGAGGVALAIGLVAIAGAMVALSGGNALSSIGNAFSSVIGGEDPIQQILDLTHALSELSNTVIHVPQIMQSIVPMATMSGIMVAQGFGNGMVVGLNSVQAQLASKITSMLNNLQSQLNANPLKIRVEVPSMGRVNSYSPGSAMNNISNNVNNTFNVRNIQDGSTLDSLLKGAR